MPTTILGLYAAVTGGTQNALASIDIPEDGMLTGIDWDAGVNVDADNEIFAGELSFIATQQLDQNDVRGRISSISLHVGIGAAGVAVGGLQKFVGPMEINVAGGERLYLHSNSTAGVIADLRVAIHLDSRRRSVRRSARRR